MDDELVYADVFALRQGGVPAQTLVEALLERIAAVDAVDSPAALRSVLAVSESALDEARACDASGSTRPLHGIPVLVKDNIEVAGLPSTAGATSLAGRCPSADAPLVRRLRDAGAVILGTTNLSEWANIRSNRSTSGWSAVGGLTGNPWALDRSPGGSSSGSGAAVAAGLAPLAIGTETDGSITCPASLNGVAGIKPTVGAVPTAGNCPDQRQPGQRRPMARTVDEVALLLEVLTGTPAILARARQGVGGLRVGVARTWRTGHPATDELFDETVRRLVAAGASTCDLVVAVPTPAEEEDELTVLLGELIDGLGAYLPTRGPDGPQSLPEVIAHEKRHAAVELAHFGHDLFEQAVQLGGRDPRLPGGAALAMWPGPSRPVCRRPSPKSTCSSHPPTDRHGKAIWCSAVIPRWRRRSPWLPPLRAGRLRLRPWGSSRVCLWGWARSAGPVPRPCSWRCAAASSSPPGPAGPRPVAVSLRRNRLERSGREGGGDCGEPDRR